MDTPLSFMDHVLHKADRHAEHTDIDINTRWKRKWVKDRERVIEERYWGGGDYIACLNTQTKQTKFDQSRARN
jgi:hypothetical protein